MLRFISCMSLDILISSRIFFSVRSHQEIDRKMAFKKKKTMDHVQPSVWYGSCASKMHIKNVLPKPSLILFFFLYSFRCYCYSVQFFYSKLFLLINDSSCDSVLFLAFLYSSERLLIFLPLSSGCFSSLCAIALPL